MKLFRRIYLITLGVLSLVMGVIAVNVVHDFWGQVVMLTGMIAGALGMFLIAMTEAFPEGLYLRLSLTDKTARQIRIL